jgi:hypothetical protein
MRVFIRETCDSCDMLDVVAVVLEVVVGVVLGSEQLS